MDGFRLSGKIYITGALLLLLLFSVAKQCSANCDNVLHEQDQCFASRGLSVPVLDPLDLLRSLDVVCGQQDLYSEALRCVDVIRHSCQAVQGHSLGPAISPDVERVMQGIAFVCSRLQDVDNQCLQTSHPALRDCVDRKTMVAGPGYRPFPALGRPEEQTCGIMQVWLECQEETYRSCPSRTMDVLAELMTKYFTPETCQPQALTFEENSLLTVLPLEATPWMSKLPRRRRSTCPNLQTLQMGCFARENINFQTPNVSSATSLQSLSELMMQNEINTRALCGADALARRRAIDCIANVSQQCLPQGSDMSQDSSKTNSLINELCSHVGDVNYNCIANKMPALTECASRKAQGLQPSSVESMLCSIFEMSAECFREAYTSCGCRTTYLFIKIIKDYINQPTCPAIKEPTPVCVPGTDLYASRGASWACQASSIAAVCLAAAFAWRIFSF